MPEPPSGFESSYVYVVVAPPSYEHAHTFVFVLKAQVSPVPPQSKHTLLACGASPTAGSSSPSM